MQRIKKTGISLLELWVDFVQANRIAVLIVFSLLVVLGFNYTINNLGMNTSTKDMLSAELPWRQLDLQYEKQFPQYDNNILVVIEAETPDQAEDAANILYNTLLEEDALFSSVFYPRALSIFREDALLFLDTNELQDLADNLARIQPFLSRLTADQTLRGLFSMLSEAVDAIKDGEEIDLEPLLIQITKTIDAARLDQSHRVSWNQLMSGDKKAKEIYREFIILQPILDHSELLPAKPVIEKLRLLIEKPLFENTEANIRLSGSAVLAYEEMLSVSRGTEVAMLLAFLAVSVIMIIGLGSIKLVIVSLLTLITGLIFTTTFASIAIGSLNMISVAFAVLYIGLGVDFAIHYCLRYRELILNGVKSHDALDTSSVDIGSSLFLCAITTATGFFAFVPTDYNGVAELGLISGVGMLISLIVTLTVLPALLACFPMDARKPRKKITIGMPLPDWVFAFPITHARGIKIVAAVLFIVFIALLPYQHFDYNTLNLQDQDNESVQTYQDLLQDSDTSPWTGVILAKGKEDAVLTVNELEKLSVVDNVVWLNDFIPADQEEKLFVIEEMDILLSGIPQQKEKTVITTEQQYEALTNFQKKLKQSKIIETNPLFNSLNNSLRDYLQKLAKLPELEYADSLQALSQNLLASLPGRLALLDDSLNADYISRDNLPQELADRWHNSAGYYRLEIYPTDNLNDNGAMREFVNQIRTIDTRLIGAPVVNLEASDAVVKAFKEAFTYAFIVISLFLFALLDKRKDTFIVLTPLVMAAVFTSGVSIFFDIPFNFANVIALPLLLGIGVDSGIHILHRFRTALPNHNHILATSSARAVVVSALTTVCSIGNLALSPHAGTSSMGKLLSIGIAITLVCMLIILPSLLANQIKHKTNE